MLRLIFVTGLIVAGIAVAAHSAFGALLFYLWNAYFRPDDWTYGGFVASLRLSWIIGIYLVARTIASLPDAKVNFRTALIWLFFVQAIIGTIASEDRALSWGFLTDFAKVLLITYLIVVLVTDRRQFRLVLLVMAMSLGFETAKQGWATLVIAPGAQNSNPIVFLGDNNGVAVGTMMLLPVLGALVQTSKAAWERNLHRLVAVGVFLRGITTYSRGGFLGAGALALIMIVRAERKVRAIVVVLVLGLLMWSVMPAAFWQRMDTITVGEDEELDSSAAGRLHFWNVAVDMAQAKPLTGVGLNAYSHSYERYNTDERFVGVRAAHSIWFGVLGDLGYPGLLLFIANFALALWSCRQVVALARGNPTLKELRIFANALIASLVVFAVSGSFLSAHYSEMAWHFVGLSTALHLLAVREHEAQKAALPPRVAA